MQIGSNKYNRWLVLITHTTALLPSTVPLAAMFERCESPFTLHPPTRILWQCSAGADALDILSAQQYTYVL